MARDGAAASICSEIAEELPKSAVKMPKGGAPGRPRQLSALEGPKPPQAPLTLFRFPQFPAWTIRPMMVHRPC